MLSQLNRKLTNLLIFLTLLVLSISNLYPLFYMFMNSVKSRTDYFVNPFGVVGLNRHGTIITMISQFKIFNLFKNSFTISFFSIVLLLSIGVVSAIT
jgi:raffinose/stachyose/melibiose transport system permease protein